MVLTVIIIFVVAGLSECAAPPSQCKFPFEYKDTKITECTTLNSNQAWCSLDSVYEGRWVYCQETLEDKFDKLLKKQLDSDAKIKELEEKNQNSKDTSCRCQKELSLIAANQIRTDRVTSDHERRLKSCDTAESSILLLIQRITKLEVEFPKLTSSIKQPLHGGETCAPRGNINYLFVAHNKNFQDAENYCASRGGHLAAPQNRVDNHWLGQTARGKKENAWWYIGANDIRQERHFVNTDGSGLGGADWWHGEPNNAGGNEDCVHYGLAKGGEFHRWNDIPCAHGAYFICQINNPKYC